MKPGTIAANVPYAACAPHSALGSRAGCMHSSSIRESCESHKQTCGSGMWAQKAAKWFLPQPHVSRKLQLETTEASDTAVSFRVSQWHERRSPHSPPVLTPACIWMILRTGCQKSTGSTCKNKRAAHSIPRDAVLQLIQRDMAYAHMLGRILLHSVMQLTPRENLKNESLTPFTPGLCTLALHRSTPPCPK